MYVKRPYVCNLLSYQRERVDDFNERVNPAFRGFWKKKDVNESPVKSREH